MLLAAQPSAFIDNNPTIKMLPWPYHLIGAYWSPRLQPAHPAATCTGMGFSGLVEGLNLWAKRRALRKVAP